MTLDALLAAIIFDDCGDIDKAHSDIPLKNTDGLWHGSGDSSNQSQSVSRFLWLTSEQCMI